MYVYLTIKSQEYSFFENFELHSVTGQDIITVFLLSTKLFSN